MREIKFVTNENKHTYIELVSTWLQNDWQNRGRPENHFFHNLHIIQTFLNKNQGVVALTAENQLAGYMVWDLTEDRERADIVIIEVSEHLRRQGIMTAMLKAFSDRFKDILVLYANVIPQSEGVFENAGWVAHCHVSNKLYYKVLAPSLQPVSELPAEGLAIAVCPVDFYVVRTDPAQYREQFQYFPVDAELGGSLSKPIIHEFNSDYYMATYFNGALVEQGKAKHIFSSDPVCSLLGLLILNKFSPENFGNYKGKDADLHGSKRFRFAGSHAGLFHHDDSENDSDREVGSLPSAGLGK